MSLTAGPAARPVAVVVAMDCITGLQTARILAARDVPVVGFVNDPNHFCARTRVVRRLAVGPTNGEGLIDALERLAPTLGPTPVLIPCADGAVLWISRGRDRLKTAGYRFVLPETAMVERLMDKVEFAEFAEAANLPIPATRVLRTRADAMAAAESMIFPAVVKPALKTAAWTAATRAKVFRVGGPDELVAAWDRWAPTAGVLLAQSWIEGDESALVSVNGYADRDGRVRILFTARKIRQWPPDTGTSCLGEEIRDDEARAITEQLLDRSGYRGLIYVECKRDARTGRLSIVEPNVGRPTGRSAICEAGGVELVLSAYLDALGEPLPEATEQTYRGTKWIYWRHDLQAAAVAMARGRLSPWNWWRSVRGPKWEAVWDPKDPRPFALDVTRTAAAAGAAVWRRVWPS